MTDTAIKRRMIRAKQRTKENLESIFSRVITVNDCPANFFVPAIKTFYCVELDEIQDKILRQLKTLKNESDKDVAIYVHLYKRGSEKPELIKI